MTTRQQTVLRAATRLYVGVYLYCNYETMKICRVAWVRNNLFMYVHRTQGVYPRHSVRTLVDLQDEVRRYLGHMPSMQMDHSYIEKKVSRYEW